MIVIEINVTWFYDWREVAPESAVPEGTEVRQSATGALIRRVVRDTPSVHTIAMQRGGLDEYIAGRVAAGRPKTLVSALLHHIDELAEAHPPVEAWTDLTVTVRGDEALSAQLTGQLKAFYGLPKPASPAPQEV